MNEKDLRDYFAGQAMVALLQSAQTIPVSVSWPTLPDIAAKSYKMADAMLEERGK